MTHTVPSVLLGIAAALSAFVAGINWASAHAGAFAFYASTAVVLGIVACTFGSIADRKDHS